MSISEAIFSAAREDPIPGVTGHLVIDALEGISQLETIHYVEEMSEAPGLLAGLVTPGDLVVTLGAGDVTRVGPALVVPGMCAGRGLWAGRASPGAAWPLASSPERPLSL